MSIAAGLTRVRATIREACLRNGRDPGEVTLLAVSKTRPAAAVREALEQGQAVFGENKVQELLAKSEELRDSGAKWHLIGPLQTNKAKFLPRMPGLELLHSLDRERLADTLEKVFAAREMQLDVLIQVNATGEADKHGVEPDRASSLLAHVTGSCPHLRPRGVMAMGPLAGDPRPVFDRVADLRAQLQSETSMPLPVLSLGMTGDLEDAIAAGSTLVRVGTAVFGERT